MMSQLHQVKAATSGFQRRVEVTTDNLANANTVGFKSHEMNFESLLPFTVEKVIQDIQDPTIPLWKKKSRYVEFGTSTRQADQYVNWSQGGFENSNRELDLAIEGQGLFQFRMPDGSTAYGRAGNLELSAERLLTDPNGHVLEPGITIPENANEIIINRDGIVYTKTSLSDEPNELGQIVLAKFNNMQGLKGIGQNLYLETELSGEPILLTPGTKPAGNIRQKYLETSNVNTIEEMMNLLMGQRMFQMNVGQIKTGNDIQRLSFDIAA